VGPITRQVADAADVLQVIAGHDPADPTTASAPVPDFAAGTGGGIAGLRIGIPDRHFNRLVQPTVAAAFAAAVARLVDAGAVLMEIALPTLDRAMDTHLLTILAEAAAYHRARFPGRDAEYGADVREALSLGDAILASDYLQAQRLRRAALADALAAFTRVDVLATPTLPTEAPAVGQATIVYPNGEEDGLLSLIRFTCPFNQTGLPALSVPVCGGDGGLPVGLQLVAPPFAEVLLVQAAEAVQRLDDRDERTPPLVRQG
jgi:aspartyl-tRNA(Asn)/glutamyl-tRNA(Gln) amidotransferase subunit A